MLWIKNTAGKPDAMLTFAFYSFLVVTLNVLLATFGTITKGEVTIQFIAMDAGAMTAYLGATFTAYVTRRWTDKRFGKKHKQESKEEEEEPEPL